MLTGRRAFEGETISDTLAAVLEREPDWTALPAATPSDDAPTAAAMPREGSEAAAARHRRRARSETRGRAEAERCGTAGTSTECSGERAALAGAGPWSRRHDRRGCGGSPSRSRPDSAARGRAHWAPSSYRFIPLAAEPADETSPSWSPDGKSIVYVAEVDGLKQLSPVSLDSAVSTQITKSPIDCLAPFWSPDGARVYFISFDASGGGGLMVCRSDGWGAATGSERCGRRR